MAKLSKDGKFVEVEFGDTLTQIAVDYCSGYSKYKQLAAINNISNPDKIVVGQEIALTPEAAGGSGSTTPAKPVISKPTIKQFGLLSTDTSTIFATWDWPKSNTESYKVMWYYDPGNGTWFVGTNTTISVDTDEPSASRQSTYSIPANAKRIKFKVKPISEKKKSSGGAETTYWTASWSDEKIWTDSTPLEAPSTPTVEIDKYKLTATLDNVKIAGAVGIEFQVVKNNATKAYATKQVKITSAHASHVFNVDPGGEYKVRARAYDNSKQYSDWSDYSNNEGTMPATPSGITTIRATSETAVYLEWSTADTATSYDIEYTTKKNYFDGSDQTTVKSGIEFNHYEITGLESGTEYFFRVRATNADGSSGWSDIKSIVIGKDPAAPTTWSSTTTGITGEQLILYWVHNSEDGSSESYAELELYFNGQKETHTIRNTRPEADKDKTSFYTIDTSTFVEGTVIQWRVRTAGITRVYGDWSVQRTIDIYAPPTLQLSMTKVDGQDIDTLTEFPFYIYAVPGPNTQIPIGYHLSVTANEIYETTDNIGNPKTVNAGDQVYSKFFDIQDALLVEFSAGNIDLENNIEYTVTCTVSMNSGLTSEASLNFTVNWTDIEYSPDAEIGINKDTWTASIRPYCDERRLVNYKVTAKSRYEYSVTDEEVGAVYGEVVPKAKTTTGLPVYLGTTVDGSEVYYCSVEEVTPITDVLLSVYRREFDGSFTELATGLDAAKYTTVTDPHPALDYARYRIVAVSKTTGAVSFYDPPGYPVGGSAVIIQWDADWVNFDTTEESELAQPPWSGSLVQLPYNIKVSDSYDPDVSLVNYIGRKRPVGYYGTHLGEKSTWNVDIPKSDKETLYALRRLAVWMGDVYVREPSGSGYWASIKVSLGQDYDKLIIPVTFTITRVEGGV